MRVCCWVVMLWLGYREWSLVWKVARCPTDLRCPFPPACACPIVELKSACRTQQSLRIWHQTRWSDEMVVCNVAHLTCTLWRHGLEKSEKVFQQYSTAIFREQEVANYFDRMHFDSVKPVLFSEFFGFTYRGWPKKVSELSRIIIKNHQCG